MIRWVRVGVFEEMTFVAFVTVVVAPFRWWWRRWCRQWWWLQWWSGSGSVRYQMRRLRLRQASDGRGGWPVLELRQQRVSISPRPRRSPLSPSASAWLCQVTLACAVASPYSMSVGVVRWLFKGPNRMCHAQTTTRPRFYILRVRPRVAAGHDWIEKAIAFQTVTN